VRTILRRCRCLALVGNQEIGLRLADFEENPALFQWAHSRRLTIHNSNSALGSVQFSIIIPAHNDWNLLEGCLRSLAEQTNRLKFEVIVVDDGSRDPAPESIREWKIVIPCRLFDSLMEASLLLEIGGFRKRAVRFWSSRTRTVNSSRIAFHNRGDD